MVCRARTDYWTPRVRRVAALFASVRRQNGNASNGAPHQPPAGLQFSSAGHGTPYIRSYRNTTAVGNVRKLFPVALGTYVKNTACPSPRPNRTRKTRRSTVTYVTVRFRARSFAPTRYRHADPKHVRPRPVNKARCKVLYRFEFGGEGGGGNFVEI